MYNYPSRADKRQARFYLKAEKGELFCEEWLYKSEIRKLQKQGFEVTLKELDSSDCFEKPLSKQLYLTKISWGYAYGPLIPYIVYQYIIGTINTFPQNHFDNFAQELYIIAKRNNGSIV